MLKPPYAPLFPPHRHLPHLPLHRVAEGLLRGINSCLRRSGGVCRCPHIGSAHKRIKRSANQKADCEICATLFRNGKPFNCPHQRVRGGSGRHTSSMHGAVASSPPLALAGPARAGARRVGAAASSGTHVKNQLKPNLPRQHRQRRRGVVVASIQARGSPLCSLTACS